MQAALERRSASFVSEASGDALEPFCCTVLSVRQACTAKQHSSPLRAVAAKRNARQSLHANYFNLAGRAFVHSVDMYTHPSGMLSLTPIPAWQGHFQTNRYANHRCNQQFGFRLDK
jgi:hypothetical protein